MLSDALIRSLREDQRFQQFTEHLLEVIEKLDSARGLSDLSNDRAGEEVKVRSQVVVVLQQILRPFVNFTEKRAVTQEELSKAKERYGL